MSTLTSGTATNAVNRFHAARRQRATPIPPSKRRQPQYAELPAAPRNASPAPRLTSLYHFAEPGSYGSRAYPGHCGGNLIKDLLRFYAVKSVFDPMTGSGTCRDVCKRMAIYCYSSDLHQGQDACDPAGFRRTASTLPGCTRPTGGKNFIPTICGICHGHQR
jgi:hypothetical protein